MKLFGFEFMKTPELTALVDKAVTEQIAKTLNWASFFSTGKPLANTQADKTAYKSVPSVYKSIKAIIDNAPQAKPSFVNKAGETVKNDELAVRFANPSTGKSWNDFIGEIAGFYQLTGEIAILKEEGTLGEQSGNKLPSLVVLDPTSLVHKIENDRIAGWTYGNKQYTTDDIIFSKDFNPSDLYRGLSPLSAISKEINLDELSSLFNKSFFDNDATPHLVLETDKTMTEPQREQVRAWWKAKHQGADKAGSMAVLEGGLKAHTISATHKDMDYMEQKKFCREEILGEYRAPKALFNITDNLNYATFTGQMKVFWLYTLMPMLRKVEDAINYGYMVKYGRGTFFAFDYRNVPAFHEDFKDKVLTAQSLFNMGFTRNEINDELEFGFEKKPWGDEWWINAGMSPASAWTEPEELPEETPQDSLGKAIEAKFYTQKQATLLRGFIKRQTPLETQMFRKLKRHFYSMRAKLLALPDIELGAQRISINWEQSRDELKSLVEPIVRQSILAGIQNAEESSTKSAEDPASVAGEQSTAYLQLRLVNITGIEETIRKQLLSKIKTSIEGGVIEGATMTEIATGVRDLIRDYFNNAGVKAKLIARTETVGAMNGGALLYYKEAGFDKKMWVTANDELVRESHRHCQGQGWIPMDNAFTNGLLFPGDQDTGDAGEVVNCRCTLEGE